MPSLQISPHHEANEGTRKNTKEKTKSELELISLK